MINYTDNSYLRTTNSLTDLIIGSVRDAVLNRNLTIFQTFPLYTGAYINNVYRAPFKQIDSIKDVGPAAGMLFANTLNSAGEDLDILASSVKAVLPVQWTDAKKYRDDPTLDNPIERLGSVWGFNPKQRYNYNLDTGNWFFNFAGEVLVDPMTWYTFGSKAALKKGAKDLFQNGVSFKDASITVNKLKLDLDEAAIKKAFKDRMSVKDMNTLVDILYADISKKLPFRKGSTEEFLVKKDIRKKVDEIYVDYNNLLKNGRDDTILSNIKTLADIDEEKLNKIYGMRETDKAIRKFVSTYDKVAWGIYTPMAKGAVKGVKGLRKAYYNREVRKNQALKYDNIKNVEIDPNASDAIKRDAETSNMARSIVRTYKSAQVINKIIDDRDRLININNLDELNAAKQKYLKELTDDVNKKTFSDIDPLNEDFVKIDKSFSVMENNIKTYQKRLEENVITEEDNNLLRQAFNIDPNKYNYEDLKTVIDEQLSSLKTVKQLKTISEKIENDTFDEKDLKTLSDLFHVKIDYYADELDLDRLNEVIKSRIKNNNISEELFAEVELIKKKLEELTTSFSVQNVLADLNKKADIDLFKRFREDPNLNVLVTIEKDYSKKIDKLLKNIEDHYEDLYVEDEVSKPFKLHFERSSEGLAEALDYIDTITFEKKYNKIISNDSDFMQDLKSEIEQTLKEINEQYYRNNPNYEYIELIPFSNWKLTSITNDPEIIAKINYYLPDEELLDDTIRESNVYKLFKEVSKSDADALQTTRNLFLGLKRIRDAHDLYDHISKIKFSDKNIAAKVYDALNSFSSNISDVDRTTFALIQRANKLSNMQSVKSMSLDSFAYKLRNYKNDDFTKFVNKFIKENNINKDIIKDILSNRHDASGDVKLTWLVAEYYNRDKADIYKFINDDKNWFLDLETTSIFPDSAKPFQCSMFNPKLNKTINIKVNYHSVEEAVEDLQYWISKDLYSGLYGCASIEDFIKTFKLVNNSKPVIKLNEMSIAIDNAFKKNKILKISTYNGDLFDYPLLKRTNIPIRNLPTEHLDILNHVVKDSENISYIYKTEDINQIYDLVKYIKETGVPVNYKELGLKDLRKTVRDALNGLETSFKEEGLKQSDIKVESDLEDMLKELDDLLKQKFEPTYGSLSSTYFAHTFNQNLKYFADSNNAVFKQFRETVYKNLSDVNFNRLVDANDYNMHNKFNVFRLYQNDDIVNDFASAYKLPKEELTFDKFYDLFCEYNGADPSSFFKTMFGADKEFTYIYAKRSNKFIKDDALLSKKASQQHDKIYRSVDDIVDRYVNIPNLTNEDILYYRSVLEDLCKGTDFDANKIFESSPEYTLAFIEVLAEKSKRHEDVAAYISCMRKYKGASKSVLEEAAELKAKDPNFKSYEAVSESLEYILKSYSNVKEYLQNKFIPQKYKDLVHIKYHELNEQQMDTLNNAVTNIFNTLNKQSIDYINNVLFEDVDKLISFLLYDQRVIYCSNEQLAKLQGKFGNELESLGLKINSSNREYNLIYLDYNKFKKDRYTKKITSKVNGKTYTENDYSKIALPKIKYAEDDSLKEFYEFINEILETNYRASQGKFAISSGFLNVAMDSSYSDLIVNSKISKRTFSGGCPFEIFDATGDVSLKSKALPPFKNLYNTYVFNINLGLNKELYKLMIADSRFNIPFSVFDDLSDKEIIESMKSGKFVACYVGEDGVLRNISIDNSKDIALARERKCAVLPYDVYADSLNHLSDIDMGEAYYFFNDIMSWFKRLALVSPGLFLRNLIDSNIKMAKDIGSVPDMVKYNLEAFKKLRDFESTMKAIFENGKGDKSYISYSGFERLYRSKPELFKGMSFDEFIETYDWFCNTNSNSTSKMLNELRLYGTNEFEMSIKDLNRINTNEYWDHLFNCLLLPNNMIEKNVRYAQYLALKDQGLSKIDIMQRINKTQFNYDNKTKAQRIIELFIPFYTFTTENFIYWMGEFFTNPSFARYALDFQAASESQYDYDAYELEHNLSLRYHVMNGSIPLTDDGLVLKVNPSYLSAFNILTNPLSVLDSLYGPAGDIKEIIEDMGKAVVNDVDPVEVFKQDVKDKELWMPYAVKEPLNIIKNRLHTSQSTRERNTGGELQRIVGHALPSVFSNVVRYDHFRTESTYMNNYPRKDSKNSSAYENYKKNYSEYNKILNHKYPNYQVVKQTIDEHKKEP